MKGQRSHKSPELLKLALAKKDSSVLPVLLSPPLFICVIAQGTGRGLKKKSYLFGSANFI